MVALVASEYARSNRIWQGKLRISSFARLPESLGRTDGFVEVKLEFTFDANGRVHVVGNAVAPAELMCYACMKARRCEVTAHIDLRVVRTEDEAKEIFADFDSIVLGDGPTTIQDLIEDDILLSIPPSVCMDTEKCGNRPQELPNEKGKSYRPFQRIGLVAKAVDKSQTS